jgi:hypothetical protein
MLLSTPRHLSKILASFSPGTPRSDRYGLTAIPLGPPAGPPRSSPALTCRELNPPDPAVVELINRTSGPITLRLGDLITGGMADRALWASLAIPARTTRRVRGETVSSRWWARGQLRPAGQLPSALAALLILATRGDLGLGAIARTALWAGYRLGGADLTEGGAGCLLLHDHQLLAAHLLINRSDEDWAASFLQATSSGSGPMIEVVHDVGERIDLWMVRASAALPNAVVASSLI